MADNPIARIPHGEYIKFVKEITSIKSKQVSSICCFPCIPSMGMLIEAASQTAAALLSDSDELGNTTVGMLIACRHFNFNTKPQSRTVSIDITTEANLGNVYNSTSVIFENGKCIATCDLVFYLADKYDMLNY